MVTAVDNRLVGGSVAEYAQEVAEDLRTTAQGLAAIPSQRAHEEARRLFAAAELMRGLAVKYRRTHAAPGDQPGAA